jgi:hypothetical protein
VTCRLECRLLLKEEGLQEETRVMEVDTTAIDMNIKGCQEKIITPQSSLEDLQALTTNISLTLHPDLRLKEDLEEITFPEIAITIDNS